MDLSKSPSRSGIFFISLLLLFTGFTTNIFGQKMRAIQGKITDPSDNPVAGASVFLSHTSKGVVTSATGEFHLENLPEGKFDLVISAIGFESKVIPLSSEYYPDNLKISLARRATELAEVVVNAKDDDGWRKFGKYFFDNFIGTTRNARSCKIVNRDILRFRFSEKNNRLTVKADEPIIVENPVLGYKVSFQLIEFTADFNADIVAYYGHPLFIDVKQSDEKKQCMIINNRRQAYYGSLMHFIRSVYEDSLKQENFVVRTTLTRANVEKERVKEALHTADSMFHRSRYKISDLAYGYVHVTTTEDTIGISQDSLRYYKKILKQQDTSTQMETLESLSEMTTNVGAHSKFLFFKNPMKVYYTGGSNRKGHVSELMLQTPKALEILKNGSYFSPTELVTFKHWSEYEKMCNMLPLDYSPE